MKKLVLVLALVMSCAVYSNAQHRAIGGKLGYGIEASYQRYMGEKNMLSIELGFPAFYGVDATATYDWLFPIGGWEHPGSWNWYAGVGGGVGVNFYGAFSVGVAGRLGVEYNFDFPLQISLDWRPVVGPTFYSSGVSFYSYGMYSGGLAFRYRF